MITLSTEIIKDLTTKINKGIENEKTVRISELLELNVINNKLILSVTNTQFYLSIELTDTLNTQEDLHVTIDANTFIKLVSKTTTDEIKLSTENGNLIFEGNGRYIFPLELNQSGEIKVLPKIDIDRNQLNFDILGDTLYSIYDFGKNELVNDAPVDHIQKYYYLDNEGAITFTESPYLNNFKLNSKFKVLLNDRLAELFTLFKGKQVKVYLSKEYNDINTQNKVNKIGFESDNIKLISYLPDDLTTEKYPADACRSLLTKEYAGEVSLNKLELANALDRLNIFGTKEGNVEYKKIGKLIFNEDGLEILSIFTQNKEFIPYIENQKHYSYICYMNLEQLQRHANANNNDTLLVKYGNELCLSFSTNNYEQIIVEVDPSEINLG